jgi:hypothetical protein
MVLSRKKGQRPGWMVVLVCGAMAVTAAHAALQTSPPDFSGRWQPRRFVPLVKSAAGTSGVLLTIEGKLPPYNAAGQNLLWHRVDMEQRGTPVADTQDTCRPRLPQAMFNLFLSPFDIVQTPTAIVFLFEADADAPWIIRMNRRHSPHPPPSYYGESVGHWEGDTLVVDTIGLNDRTWLDGQGSPHSTKAHLVTRFDRVGSQLHIQVHVDDPVWYTRPWSYAYIADAKPNTSFYEVHCLENTRAEDNENIVYETIFPPPGVF